MKRNRKLVVVQNAYVLILLSVVLALTSSSQTTSLRGYILDGETGQPIDHVTVVLFETGQRKHTDMQGAFLFESLPSGQYRVLVHHIAYADAERIVTVAGQRDSLILHLRPSIHHSGEVVTLGARTVSSFSNSPFPLDATLTEALNKQCLVTVSDALKGIPGLSLVRDGIWGTALSVRGMSRSNIVALVDNARIETANDIAGGLSLINIRDIARVETMKSPGSVLHGSGALGGVVHLMTKRPYFSGQPKTTIEMSSSMTSVDGGTSQYLAFENAAERYAMRLSGGYRKAGNTMTPEGSLANSQYHDFSLSGMLSLKTIDEQSLLLSYQRTQAEDAGIPGGAPIASSATARYTLARRERLGLEYTVPNVIPQVPVLTVRVSRQSIDRNVEIIQNPMITVTPHAVNVATSVQVESQILLNGSDCLTAGIDLWQRQLDSRREKVDNTRNQIIGERPVPSSRYSSAGWYAQNEWHSSSRKVVLTAGARYDLVRVKNDRAMNPEYVVSSGTLQAAPSDQRLLWKESTVYDASWSMNTGTRCVLSPLLDVSMLIATAFRSPSLEERYQFIDLGNVVRIGDPNLQPERSLCINVGSHLHSERINIRADVFVNYLTDLITETPGTYEGREAYLKKNIGRARLHGFEISGECPLMRSLVVKSSISYVRGQDTRTKTDLPQIPPLNGQLGINGHCESLGTMGITCSFASAQSKLAAGEHRTPGYVVIDVDVASVPVIIGNVSLTAKSGVQNLFNRLYRNHLSTLRGIVKSEPGRNMFFSLTVSL